MRPATPPPPELQRLALELRQQPTLAPLGLSQLIPVAAVVTEERWAAGQEVLGEGDAGTDFFIIAEGRCVARRDTPVGEQIVAALGPGDLFGEISLLDGNPRSGSVVSTTAVRVWRFGGPAVAELVDADAALASAFLHTFWRSLAHKIREANVRMTEIMAPGSSPARPAGRQRGGRRVEVDAQAAGELLREHGLTAGELEILLKHLEAHDYSAGDLVFAEGEEGDALYIVAEGRVRISRHVPGMGEEALAILGRGEVFGEMALTDVAPRSADAIAHTGGCTLLALDRDRLAKILEEPPTITLQLLKLLCQMLCRRIRIMNDQLVAWRTMAAFG